MASDYGNVVVFDEYKNSFSERLSYYRDMKLWTTVTRIYSFRELEEEFNISKEDALVLRLKYG